MKKLARYLVSCKSILAGGGGVNSLTQSTAPDALLATEIARNNHSERNNINKDHVSVTAVSVIATYGKRPIGPSRSAARRQRRRTGCE